VIETSKILRSFLTGLFSLIFAIPLYAHIGEPLSSRIWVVGEEWILQTNFGVMGQHFDGFVCEEAFLGGDRFFVVPLAADRWISFSNKNVWKTDDGCSFSRIGELGGLPTDVDLELNSQQVAWVSNSSLPELRVLHEETITLGPTFSEELHLTSVRFVTSNTLVVGGYYKTQSGAGFIAMVDIESGTIEPLQIPAATYPYVLDATETQILWLGRVEAQTVFLGTPSNTTEYALEITSWPTDARIIENGVVISGLNQSRGLTIGTLTGEDLEWETYAEETSAMCVRPYGDGYLVCALRRFDVADLVFIRPGSEPEPVVHFEDLEGPRICPAGTESAQVCPTVWPEIARQLGLLPPEIPVEPEPMEEDAEEMGTNPNDDPPVAPPKKETCSSAGGLISVWLLIAVGGLRRPRNGRRFQRGQRH